MGTKRQLAILGSTGSIGTQALQVVAEHADGIDRRAAILGLLGLVHSVFGHAIIEATPARHAVGEDNDHTIAALVLNRIQNAVGHLQAQIREGAALRLQFINGSIQSGVIRVQQRLSVVLLRSIGTTLPILLSSIVGIGTTSYKHFGIAVIVYGVPSRPPLPTTGKAHNGDPVAVFLRLIGTDRSYEGFNRLLQSIQLLDFPAVTAGIERSSVKGRVPAATSNSQLSILASSIFVGQIVGIVSVKPTGAYPFLVPRYSIIFAVDLHVIFRFATEIVIRPAAVGRTHKFIGVGGNFLSH